MSLGPAAWCLTITHRSSAPGCLHIQIPKNQNPAFPLTPEQRFCPYSRALAAANPGSWGHHAARQHQGSMGFRHSLGWVDAAPSFRHGAQHHVPCNEKKTIWEESGITPKHHFSRLLIFLTLNTKHSCRNSPAQGMSSPSAPWCCLIPGSRRSLAGPSRMAAHSPEWSRAP